MVFFVVFLFVEFLGEWMMCKLSVLVLFVLYDMWFDCLNLWFRCVYMRRYRRMYVCICVCCYVLCEKFWSGPGSNRGPSACKADMITTTPPDHNRITHQNHSNNIQSHSYYKYNPIQYNTIQYNTIHYNIIQYSTIQYNTIESNRIESNQPNLFQSILIYLNLF